MSATTDTLPHNVEHEASLLGSMLVTNDIIDMGAYENRDPRPKFGTIFNVQ